MTRPWLLMMGGMLVWTIHFFALYALASVFESTAPARIGTGLVTAACLAANIWLLAKARQWARTCSDPILAWTGSVGMGAAALSLVAVAYQGLPALLS